MPTTAQEAVKPIKSGDNVFVHSAAAIPRHLIAAMTERHSEVRGVNIYIRYTLKVMLHIRT
ncbi:hypothetical protein N8368_00635 [Bacteroidia bacterium]|nr:hypothetical protein [Bacteroidia bacterium]MDC1394994.1 hypothetical protein [Bacteroidia bacterium]